jgi:leucyl-tRNA synthetase
VCEDEPFCKLINQGMIQGRSNFVYLIPGTNKFVSAGLKDQYETIPVHVDVNIVYNDKLDIEAFRAWRPDYKDAEFVLENGEYICGWAIEKMSKSMYNVVNPDKICDTYGADTLRLYEMFLGPIEQAKPWDTKGIDGVNRFLKKFWRLFWDRDAWLVTDDEPTKEELKALHPVFITGRESAAQKENAVTRFMEGKTDLCCVSLRAASGLNLQRATCVVFGELDWSPAVHSQAEDRAHRIGHEDSLLCYYLVAPAGSDLEMQEALGLKVSQFEGLMGDTPISRERQTEDAHFARRHVEKLAEQFRRRREGGRL